MNKIMMILTEDGPLGYRPKILLAVFSDYEEEPREEILWEGLWQSTQAKSNEAAETRYWPLYEFHHGFKHPQDPRRTAEDFVPPDMVVMTAKDASL